MEMSQGGRWICQEAGSSLLPLYEYSLILRSCWKLEEKDIEAHGCDRSLKGQGRGFLLR